MATEDLAPAPEMSRRISDGQRRFESNLAKFRARWTSLLAEHRGEWAAIFESGEALANSQEEVLRRIPPHEISTAVVHLVDEAEGVLLL